MSPVLPQEAFEHPIDVTESIILLVQHVARDALNLSNGYHPKQHAALAKRIEDQAGVGQTVEGTDRQGAEEDASADVSVDVSKMRVSTEIDTCKTPVSARHAESSSSKPESSDSAGSDEKSSEETDKDEIMSREDINSSRTSLESSLEPMSKRQRLQFSVKRRLSDLIRRVHISRDERPSALCIACTESVPLRDQVLMPECGHVYCRGCFNALLSSNLQTEDRFPPKCCSSHIASKTIMNFATLHNIDKYIQMQHTITVPPFKRWWCPRPSCNKAFDVEKATISRSKGIVCPHCSKGICVSCRQSAHKSEAKCEDPALMQTLVLSKQKNWQTCGRCGNVIEMIAGCRHMVCTCRFSFCYVCGKKWKHCKDGSYCSQILFAETERRNNSAHVRNTPDYFRHANFVIWGPQARVGSALTRTTDILQQEMLEIMRKDKLFMTTLIQDSAPMYERFAHLSQELDRVEEHQRQEIRRRHGLEASQPGPSTLPDIHQAELEKLAELALERRQALRAEKDAIWTVLTEERSREPWHRSRDLSRRNAAPSLGGDTI